MAKPKVLISLRQKRTFSDALKKKIVKDIEGGKATVSLVSREYQVSYQAIYMWLRKFSAHLHPATTIVMQMESEQYRTKELEKKVAELEAALGRKQMEIDFLNKVIEVADLDLGIDLKKNIVTHASTGTKKTKGKRGSS